MFNQSSETYVAWATGLLLLGAMLAALGGAAILAQVRGIQYYQLRRQSLTRGWQLIFLSLVLAAGGGIFYALGLRAMEAVHPPTLTLTPSLTPSITLTPSETPTLTPIPSATLTPEDTLTPSLTPTESNTPTLTPSPTPALPIGLMTRPASVTVSPPPNAGATDLRLAQRDNCTIAPGVEFFDQIPKTIYAHFYYENWLPGMEWAGVWLRDGQVIYVEVHQWVGSTGGCGFTSYDNVRLWWPVGDYEVQIFVGERWLLSKTFPIVRSTPTPTITYTRTPRTPTLTLAPSNTPTPQPPRTATHTRTPRTPTLTPTVTHTRTPRPTWTATVTRTPRPTRPTWTPSRTPRLSATPTETPTP